MVAFTPAEGYGNFIQEARAMNVPIYLLMNSENKPFYWSNKSGRVRSIHTEVEDLESDFKVFLRLATEGQFEARKDVESTCARVTTFCGFLSET
jgi:hypothetical protein